MIAKLIKFIKRKRFDENRIDSLICEHTTSNGDMFYAGNLVINGHLNGDIKMTIPEPKRPTCAVIINGQTRGSIEGDFVVVSGTVEGSIFASEKLIVKKTGKINGSITYGSLQIEDGAVITGLLNVLTEEDKEKVIPIQSVDAILESKHNASQS